MEAHTKTSLPACARAGCENPIKSARNKFCSTKCSNNRNQPASDDAGVALSQPGEWHATKAEAEAAVAADKTLTLLQRPDSASGPNGENFYTRRLPDADIEKDATSAAAQFDARDEFIKRYGDEVRWVEAEGSWYLMSRTSRPGIWSVQNREGTSKRMQSIAEGLSHSRATRSSQFVREALTAVKPHVAIAPTEFDADPHLLGTPSGVVDLRTGALRPVLGDDLISKSTAVPYDPQAECPTWAQHLRVMTRSEESIVGAKGNDETIGLLQVLAGLNVCGKVLEHRLPYLYPTSGSGKGVFADTLLAVLGDYGAVLDPTVMYARPDAHTTGIAALRGVRLAVFDEASGAAPNVATLKRLTGGMDLTGRFMRQDNITFAPSHMLLILSNHEPRFENDTIGIDRRLIAIRTGPRIPTREADPNIEQKLLAEGPGILRWMVEGFLRYQREGLVIPADVERNALDILEASRVFAQFLREKYTPDPAAFTLLSEVRTDYENWLQANGDLTPNNYPTSTQVSTLLRAEDATVVANSRAKNQRCLMGYRPYTPEEKAAATKAAEDAARAAAAQGVMVPTLVSSDDGTRRF